MKLTICCIWLFCAFNPIHAQNLLEEKLFDLPDVSFEKISTPVGFEAAYELRVKQPIDHEDLTKGFFYQRVFLSHKSLDKPMLMCTEGYQRKQNRIYELSGYLDANQLDIEHRYFGKSVPKEMDYAFLNLEQATADLHKINLLFKQLYQSKWLSTGISKGGQTTIFYRYFYPNDVDLSIPYVAPINLSLEDERIYTFLDTVGNDACRNAIRDVQLSILNQYDEALEKMSWFCKGARLKFEDYLSVEEAFEYTLLEYPFSFWQWGGDCTKIPSKEAPLDDLLSHVLNVCDPAFFADGDMKNYASHYYQAGNQMGYYGYNIEPFSGLLKALPTNSNPSAVFMPKDTKPAFDGALPNKVFDWLQSADGDGLAYIYGGSDTWSATAVPYSKKPDSAWFFLPGKDHGQARIKNMSKNQQQAFADFVFAQTGIEFISQGSNK